MCTGSGSRGAGGATTRAFLPYLVVLILGLLVITYVTWFTLVLPHLVYGR